MTWIEGVRNDMNKQGLQEHIALDRRGRRQRTVKQPPEIKTRHSRLLVSSVLLLFV